MTTTITKHLVFNSRYGLFYQSDEETYCIASLGLYITPLYAMALMGKLANIFHDLLRTREWEQLKISTTFISYKELYHYVKLATHPDVNNAIPENQKTPLNKLVRIVLQWVVYREDQLVSTSPNVWFEPSFYPIKQNEYIDPYNRYDPIPIKGFARSAFYFFIANTAKNIIKSAIQDENLLSACKIAFEECENILNDKCKVEYHPGLYRKLLDTYLDWRYTQTELILAHNISLSSDDLWQHIFNEETEAYELFKTNMDKHRLYDMRPLLELQENLLERLKKDHPYISMTGKSMVPIGLPKEKDYIALVAWLEDEKLNGRDYLADHDYNLTKMCEDTILCKKIGWYKVNANSLRKAITRRNNKSSNK